MTDKPRLIDADKLIKQLQDNRDLFAEDKVGSPSYNMGRVDSYHTMITWINNGHFDPAPPQHPDIQVGERYWQKRLERERERADSAEAEFQALNDSYDELKKEKDYWERKRTEHKNRADRAESLIQRKDTEIAALKRLAEFWGSQYSDAITYGEETEERLNIKIAGLTALLQDKGDKL